MVRLAQKAFYPGKIPFPLLHVDTGFKFQEMYEFRDRFVEKIQADLRIYSNRALFTNRLTHLIWAPKNVAAY